MAVKNPKLIKDGKVDWQMFERLIIGNPHSYMGEIFDLDELKVLMNRDNISEYRVHLNSALDKRDIT